MTESHQSDADRLEEQAERLQREIDDARKDWESKEQDASVPGAQPDPDDDSGPDDPDV
jgi:hypothetical protein